MIRTIPLFLLGLAPLLVAQSPASVPAPFDDVLPALRAQSVWQIDVTGESDDPRARGPIPIGNGYAFAALGLGSRACALDAMTGPTYGAGDVERVGDGAFGGLVLDLLDREGRALGTDHHRVARVVDAGVAVAEDEGDGVALRLCAFVPEGLASLFGIVEVAAGEGDLPDGLKLRLRTTRAARADADRLLLADGDAMAVITLSGGRGRDGALVTPIPTGRLWRGVIEIATATGDAPERAAFDVDAARRALATTLETWHARLAPTPSFDCDRLRVRDLFRDHKVNLLTQRCATTGAIVPMLGRRVFSLRTQTGAMLALLRLRLHTEAHDVLKATFTAVRAAGRLDEDYPLDLKLSAPDAARFDGPAPWRTLPMLPAELPSLVLLQHYWYWRTTGDLTPIDAHALLLETCLKRPVRGTDSLMPFSGHEPWSPAALARLDADLLGDDPSLFGETPTLDLSSSSFVSAVLFMLSVQAYGELSDARDARARPTAWADGKPTDAPSHAYLRSSFGVLQEIEKRYWMADIGRFAPAVSAVNGSAVREVLANANLMPLWAGWTYPTGEKSRENLRNSLAGVWQGGARIGTTRTLPIATGDLIGMLLVALSERDDARRMDVLDEMLHQAGATGTWSDRVDGDGMPLDPDGDGPGRAVLCDPGTSSVNFDAMMFAMTGIRHAAVPSWDDDDIRLELRLPNGAEYVSLRGASKDGRVLDLFFRRSVGVMNEEERRANDEASPERRRDPNVPHERMRFIVELVEGDPPEGYYHVDIDAMGTMFVRFLKREAPAGPDDHDFRRVEEMEFSKPDANEFLQHREGPGAAPQSVVTEIADAADTLVVTNRPHLAELVHGATVTICDSGTPLSLDLLRSLLLEGGKPRHARLLLDWGFDAAPPVQWNRALFASAGWTELLAAYRKAGGAVITPGFVRTARQDGAAVTADADGAFRLPAGAEPIRLVIDVPARTTGPLTLHAAASVGYRVHTANERLLSGSGRSPTLPDREATLLPRSIGSELVVEVDADPERSRVLFLRFAGSNGLPLR